MRNKDAQTIIMYYHAIPGMQKLLQESRDILDDYGLRGVQMDGMPHGSAPGKPVESMAIALDESGAAERLEEIEKRLEELESDRRIVQQAVDAIHGKYKTILSMRYDRKYSWGGISVRLSAPDSTVRHWHDRALYRLGKVLEESNHVQELCRRASHARV